MVRLPRLLSTDDFAIAELCALRCDGELVAVDESFAPIDELTTPSLRAAAVQRRTGGRLIAERLSAAWIWGAWPDPPAPHQFCTDIESRVAHVTSPLLDVREVVLSPADTVDLGGLAVTTPIRTIADIARFATTWGQQERAVIDSLYALAGVPRHAVRAELDRVRLPHKRRALDRLGLSPTETQPELTR